MFNVGTLCAIRARSMVHSQDYHSWGIRVADNAVALILASDVHGLDTRVLCLTRSYAGSDVLGWTAIGNLISVEARD